MNHQLRKDREKFGGSTGILKTGLTLKQTVPVNSSLHLWKKENIKRMNKEQVRHLKGNRIMEYHLQLEYEKEWEREDWNCVWVWWLSIKPLRHFPFSFFFFFRMYSWGDCAVVVKSAATSVGGSLDLYWLRDCQRKQPKLFFFWGYK